MMIAEPPTKTPALSALAGSELRKLALHSSHYLAGLVGGLLVGLVAFPLFTRRYSVAEYGLLDLVQRVTLMLTIVSKGGLQNAVLRFYDKRRFATDPNAAKQYYSTMYWGAVLLASLVAVVFLAVLRLVPGILKSGAVVQFGYVIIALVVVRALGTILWGVLRIEERTTVFNVSSVAARAATVLVICALLPVMGATVRTYYAGTIAVELLVVAIFTFWLARRGVLGLRHLDAGLLRAGVLFGVPLVAYELAFAVLGSADRFLVRYYLGADALGLYSVASGLAQQANDLLAGPLMLAILPIYMNIWNTSGRAKTAEFLTLAFDLFSLVAAALLAVSTVSARDVVLLLASSKYEGAERFIPLLLGGFLIYATYVFFAAGMLIEKKTGRMAVLLAISAAVNIGLNCVLLRLMGLIGSAIATVLSNLLCIVLLSRNSEAFLAIRLSVVNLAKYTAAAILAVGIGGQVSLGSPLANILGKASICVVVYTAVLFATDRRLRGAAQWTLAEIRGLF